MSHPLIQIVDKHDNPVGGALMQEAQQKGLFHRIVRVMLENEEGEVLVQKRSKTMYTYPGCWDNSAAGHVDEGEDYVQAAHREMREEIGVKTDLELVEVYKTVEERDNMILNRFNAVFKGSIPKGTKLNLQESEVTDAVWMTPQSIKELIEQQPGSVTDGLEDVIKHYY